MVVKPDAHGERKKWHAQNLLEEPVWYLLHKDRIPELYESLASGSESYRMAAPVASGSFIKFSLLDRKNLGKAVTDFTDFENARLSPKEFLFPQTELMFEYSTKTGEMKKPGKSESETPTTVVFGARPCDCAAPPTLDDVFYGDFKDDLYDARRKRTLYFGLTCNSHRPGCLCVTMGGSPSGTAGMDAAMTDIGEILVVEVLTQDALDFITANKQIFEIADESAISKARQLRGAAHEKACEEMPELIDEAFIEELGKHFDDPFWEQLAERCIGCNICAFSCPTCHCFDIQDVVHGEKGKRERHWDSCQSAEYSIHTSGHNPRAGKMMRTRNRVFHKLHYYHRNFGKLLCVGCGRCAVLCPAGNDLGEVVEYIRSCMEENAGPDKKSQSDAVSEKEASE